LQETGCTLAPRTRRQSTAHPPPPSLLATQHHGVNKYEDDGSHEHLCTRYESATSSAECLHILGSRPCRLKAHFLRTDTNSPVVKYKPRKLNRLLHPRSSKSDFPEHAGRQDPDAKKARQNARETEDASKQSLESRRSQEQRSSADRRSSEASR
jgi:hypothetical protein